MGKVEPLSIDEQSNLTHSKLLNLSCHLVNKITSKVNPEKCDHSMNKELMRHENLDEINNLFETVMGSYEAPNAHMTFKTSLNKINDILKLFHKAVFGELTIDKNPIDPELLLEFFKTTLKGASDFENNRTKQTVAKTDKEKKLGRDEKKVLTKEEIDKKFFE